MSQRFAYDVVDYPGHPRPQTQPDRLAAIARLHGIAAAAPGECRYLEVGCGDGSNLLPLAMAWPRSRFVGVDLSPVAVARGERLRARLGLSNLSLQVADLTRWTPPLEAFDYVVAHGFYSWVPGAVRDALLALCRERLSPQGVAYVSYNALPGCHVRRMMWDMLRHHVAGIEDPPQRLRQAFAMLQFLEHGLIGSDTYSATVRAEIRQLVEQTDPAVLFHDDLAEINEPVSITTFVEHARRFGLEFLGEADYSESCEDAAPAGIVDKLREMAATDVVRKEQYLDFLKGRRFRQTLLCRGDARPTSLPVREAAAGLAASGHVGHETPGQPPDLAEGVRVRFHEPRGSALSVDHPVAKAMLALIGEAAPAALPVATLLEQACARAGREGAPSAADRDAALETLVLAFRLGLVMLRCDPPTFATRPGPRPRASALARAQLAEGHELVTTLQSSVVRLEDPATRALLGLLDGSRDRDALAADLAEALSRVPDASGATVPAATWRQRLQGSLDAQLLKAAGLALLEE